MSVRARLKDILLTAYAMVMLGRHTHDVRYLFLIGDA